MKLNGFIGFLVMISAWCLLSGHDYIPHHHHDYCVSSHDHHSGDHPDVIDNPGEPPHDLSCNFTQVFDKTGYYLFFPPAKELISLRSPNPANKTFTPYLKRFVPRLFQPHCPLRAPPVIL